MSPRGADSAKRAGSRSTSARPRPAVQPEAPAVAPAEPSAVSTATRVLEIPRTLTVKELADLLGISPVEVIKELMRNGVMASVNQVVDYDTAAIVAHDLGFEPQEAALPEVTRVAPARPSGRPVEEDEASLQLRPPVVTVMGHVDHGKTSILDAIRQTKVTEQEVGGITQHIGAYQAEVDGHRITFIDTPGHEAFTTMRARGAQVTDIAVLVVAADDGVMPQTIEAIDHARAAGVPIVVALNKMDLPAANQDRVKQQLSERGLVIEEWGGDTICVPMSARTGEGLKDLLENLLVVAEVQELKANPNRPAVGAVVEAELDSTRGPMATVLVQTGTLHQGDAVVVGDTWGKVKAMFDDRGQRLKSAGPSQPVKIMGLEAVPLAGDTLEVVKDERVARTTIEERQRQREAAASREQRAVTLEALFGEIAAGKVKELNVILKADVQGSIEPVRNSIERLSIEEVKVRVIHAASGTITESDVMLAAASKAIIVGFSSKPEPGARRLAEAEGVDIRYYEVIYDLVDDIQKALLGLLEPVYSDVVDGHAEVRQVFHISRRGNVAGCYVRDGAVSRGSLARVLRDEQVLAETRVDSLRRFTEDVRDVQAGYECGIGLEGFDDFQEGDVLELYHREAGRPAAAKPARPAAKPARPAGGPARPTSPSGRQAGSRRSSAKGGQAAARPGG
jgi:translation initiation factor IF-2